MAADQTSPDKVLRARALAWLAQREHSRHELRGKLVRWWARRLKTDAARAACTDPVDADADSATDADADSAADVAVPVIDAVLDALEAAGHLSEARFIQGRVRVRAERFGNRRIEAELRRCGVALDDAARRTLHESECTRAAAVSRARFGPDGAADLRERARQSRFLAARGFSPEAIRHALSRGAAQDPDEAAPSAPAELSVDR